MKTIKAKQTLHGSYGVISEGQTAEVHHKVAEDLEKRGLVTIEGGSEDKDTEQQVIEKQTLEKNKEIGSIIEPKADPKTQSKENKPKVTK